MPNCNMPSGQMLVSVEFQSRLSIIFVRSRQPGKDRGTVHRVLKRITETAAPALNVNSHKSPRFHWQCTETLRVDLPLVFKRGAALCNFFNHSSENSKFSFVLHSLNALLFKKFFYATPKYLQGTWVETPVAGAQVLDSENHWKSV